MGTEASQPQDAVPPTGDSAGDADLLISEQDRQAVVDQIQNALATDVLPFDQADERFELVYSATTRGELQRASAGLPAVATAIPPHDARHVAPSSHIKLIGDINVGGWLSLPPASTFANIIGDTTIDLSAAAIPAEGLSITIFSLVGDTKVIVPDGVRVQNDSISLLGDDTDRLVPPAPGRPIIRLRSYSAVGDVSVYSLSQVPEGKLRKFWRSLRSG